MLRPPSIKGATAKRIGTLVLAAMLVTTTGMLCGNAMASQLATSEAAYGDALQEADDASQRLSLLIGKATERMGETGRDGVSDASTYDGLDSSTRVSKNLMRTRDVTMDRAYRNGVNALVGGYDEATASNARKADALNGQADSLKDSIAAFDRSKHIKDCEDARDALQARANEAQELYDATEGRVLDPSTRESLAGAIDAANGIIGADIDDATETSAYATTGLDDAIAGVTESNRAYVAQVQAQAAQARPGARQGVPSRSGGGRGGSPSGGSGAWNVNYYQDYWTDSAAADGSMTEWAPGYYIAHRYSANGQSIASRPGTVTVNGRTYRYVSSQNVSTDTTWDQVDGYVHQNGGIGFQTCDGGTYLVTHYEPVG